MVRLVVSWEAEALALKIRVIVVCSGSAYLVPYGCFIVICSSFQRDTIRK